MRIGDDMLAAPARLAVQFYGDIALVKGVCDFRNGQPGKLLDNHLNILWAMAKRAQGPYRWHDRVAAKSTRLAASRSL